jgi:hypothetical protein
VLGQQQAVTSMCRILPASGRRGTGARPLR